MSNLKQRLHNALSQNIGQGTTSFASQRSASPFGGRENITSPNKSTNSGMAQNSVLNERVSRISDKINEIHVNLKFVDNNRATLKEERWENWKNMRRK